MVWRSKMSSGIGVAALAALALLAIWPVAVEAGDAPWPCVQRLVPKLSPALIWQGPALDGLEPGWRDDAAIAALAGRVAQRQMPAADAVAAIHDFAGAIAIPERTTRLTLLFAAIFATAESEREGILRSIFRTSRAQQELLAEIDGDLSRLGALREDADAKPAEIADLTEQIQFKRRIFKDREQLLRPLCDQPARLEERLGQLARAVLAELP
ncbi:MAG: hypothetical protein GC191_09660 [Azospirillum sp.]|nr:hypothetical protein [Azospirillum sp.]